MHQISFRFFQRGKTRTRKKTSVKYFSMRNPYMKFQNPSMHGSWTAQPETNMPRQLLQTWEHKYEINFIFLTFLEVWTQWVPCKVNVLLCTWSTAYSNEIYFLNECQKIWFECTELYLIRSFLLSLPGVSTEFLL